MSERDEELELEALQRRLDDAFETTRPRRGFEDELWLRMQRKRPLGQRLRDVFGGLAGGMLDTPGVRAGAVALVLVVLIGAGAVAIGLSGAGHNASIASTAQGGAAAVPRDYAGGQVPTPALHPGLIDQQQPSGALPMPAIASGPSANLYYGPANLVWSGAFPGAAPSAPVLVYAEPTATQQKSTASQLGPMGDATLRTSGSVAALPREPVFVIAENSAGVPPGANPVVAANAFLVAHNLEPSWPFTVSTIQAGSRTRVIFERGFRTDDGGTAYLVDWTGSRYGIEVDIVDGKRTAVGPLPLTLQTVSLPLITDADAARQAVDEPPASSAAISPTPTVKLDQVELVYALAIAHGSGFYEPAYLFTGSFSYNGQTYVKRVLVPLVAPQFRS